MADGLRARIEAFPLRQTALALVIGGVGGALASWIGLPLAWMLGSMLATTVAGLAGVRAVVPNSLRAPLLVVLGVFIGSSFRPDSLDRIAEWPWSLAAIVLLVPVFTGLVAQYYTRFAGFDPATALFSATPGGLTPMVLIAGASGGDERRVALTQGLRVFIIVLLIPLSIGAFFPLSNAGPQAAGTANDVGAVADWLILGLGVGGGIGIARLIRLPVPLMTGTMFASAALHAAGAVAVHLPGLLLGATLLVIGASVGARFSTFDRRALWSIGRHAVVAALLVIGISAIAATAISALLDLDFLATLLAFVPGGVAEMCLIAVALHVDPAFVALHHLVRLFAIVLLAPLVGAAMRRRAAAVK